jgi:Ca2+-binding RTX toxin-like protein
VKYPRTKGYVRRSELGSFTKLTIVGAADKSDAVTVDLPNVGSLLPDGIVLEGGAGGKAVDKLTVRGAAAGSTFALSAGSQMGTGIAAVDTLGIQFSGVEQVGFEGLRGNDVFAVSGLPVSLTLSDTGGADTVDFSGATGGVGVSVSLAKSSAQKAFGGTTTLTFKGKFENATGTSYADTLTGTSAANRIDGGGGFDTIDGGSGNDSLYGGDGNDLIHGGSGNDTIYGGSGNDWLYGDAGNDALFGELGNNVLSGGAGNDLLDVDLNVGSVLTGRNLLIGGMGLDTLTGGSGEEILIGGTTKYDAKPLALAAIMEEWASDTDFALRRTHLTDGISVPGNPQLGLIQLVPKDKTHPKGTVLDDKNADQLFGGPGDDWFFPFGNEVPNDG